MQYGAIIITELKPVSPRSIHIYLVPFEHFSIPPLLNIEYLICVGLRCSVVAAVSLRDLNILLYVDGH